MTETNKTSYHINGLVDSIEEMTSHINKIKDQLPDDKKVLINNTLADMKFDEKVRELRDAQNRFNNLFKEL